ncbi:MAG: hypothetical protein IJZ00_02105 [Lachnospiraceae bacterium]|nr:hypothetical protein [Lachnospiraceae bacterium]
MIMKDLKELTTVCETTHEIIVYGAGRVSYALLQYLVKEDFLDKVFCVMVSEKKNNPDNVLGIPVCSVDEVGERKDTLVLVATFENVQEEICEVLKCHNYEEIRCVSNILYAEIRRKCRDFQADVMQNTQMLRKEVKRGNQQILLSLARLEEKVQEMENCIKYGVRTSDELLTEKQYEKAIEIWYQKATGHVLDIHNPKTFNEKIQWYKLFGPRSLMTELTDKYLVRGWIKEKIGEEYLVPIYGAWDSFDEIEQDKLPEKFVLKCNHGSAWNEIVLDKRAWNVREAKRKFDRWMKSNYAFCGGLELQYRDIYPRIIAEEYLENENNDLYDYKFWCFNGKVEFIMFLSERAQGLKMNNYDRDWKLLPFTYDFPNSTREIPKPEKLDEMIEIAEKLATGFPHVRVDLYQLNDGTIKFGEMTFTSDCGVCRWSNDTIDYELGKMFEIS